MGDEITQQTLLPEVRDPNLWIVKCRIGEEKVSNWPHSVGSGSLLEVRASIRIFYP